MGSGREEQMHKRSSMGSGDDASEPISDDEELYRSIDYINRGDCKCNEDGEFVLSSQAFRDRGMRPSVDRACLRNNNPEDSKMKPSDGVVSLVANDVRAQPIEHSSSKSSVEIEYKPTTENPAHSQIYGNPDFKFSSIRMFEKLKVRLAYLAKWRVYPTVK